MCILKNSNVLMGNGILCPAQNIKVGDLVMTSQGTSKVKLIIETTLSETTEMVQIGSLFITPTHPIRINGKWILPKNHSLKKISHINFDRVFSFALESDHIMIIDDIEVISLGHEFDDPVVKHPYLGTRKIIDDFLSLKDSDEIVRFNSSDFVKNGKGGVSINPDFYERKKLEIEHQEIRLDLLLRELCLVY